MDRLDLHAFTPVALSGERCSARRKKREMQTSVATIIRQTREFEKEGNSNMFVAYVQSVLSQGYYALLFGRKDMDAQVERQLPVASAPAWRA
jgi:hypothetical protein